MITTNFRWFSPQIYLGLTLAMLLMAAVSSFVATPLARFSEQGLVMNCTLPIALSCAVMACAHLLPGWYSAWLLAGIGMRILL